MDEKDFALLQAAAARAERYLRALPQRRVFPSPSAIDALAAFDVALPDEGVTAEEVLSVLDTVGSPATVASAGPRYFGFVTGGALPAALASNWLAGAWDQNAFSEVSSPAGAAIEAVAARWLLSVLGLPETSGVAFVTGATMANFTCLAAARSNQLAKLGWDVEADGLFGAPPLEVVVSEESHAVIFKALGMLGLGRNRVRTVPADRQGRMRADKLPELGEHSIVCLQAGNVNSGASDPIEPIARQANAQGAWTHVDGAFGLWARAAPERASQVAGAEQASSWATDAHKWLNVPYDCGIAFVADPQALRRAVAINAAYLPDAGGRQPFDFTPEASRRARGVEVWAALRHLGRQGVAALIERNCALAARLAGHLACAGLSILNEVCLNQVLVAARDDDATARLLARIQADGTCWCGATQWHDQAAIRVSVSSWATTEADIDQTSARIVELAREAP